MLGTFKAPNSVALLKKMRVDAFFTGGGTTRAPNMPNGLLLQLAEYYRAHGEPGHNALSRVALGFFREGDKFQAGKKFSVAHAKKLVSKKLLTRLWIKMLRMSQAIDKREGTSQEFSASDGLSKTFWDFMAKSAFRNLQRERARKGITPKRKPAAPKPVTPKPIIKRKPVPAAKRKRIPPIPDPRKVPLPFDPGKAIPKKPGAGIGIAILLIVVLIAIGKRR